MHTCTMDTRISDLTRADVLFSDHLNVPLFVSDHFGLHSVFQLQPATAAAAGNQ